MILEILNVETMYLLMETIEQTVLRTRIEVVNLDLEVGQWFQMPVHGFPDILPAEAAEASSEFGESDRCDAPGLERIGELAHSRLDVFHSGRMLPVPLCREIENPRRPRFPKMQQAGAQLSAGAHRGVHLVHFREPMSVFEGDTPAHHTDTVDGVDQSLTRRLEDVSPDFLDSGHHRHATGMRLGRPGLMACSVNEKTAPFPERVS